MTDLAEAPLSSLVFHVEQWDDHDLRVVSILAACCNVMIGQAAYEVALLERPTNIVRLRNRAYVVAERIPAGLPKE